MIMSDDCKTPVCVLVTAGNGGCLDQGSHSKSFKVGLLRATFAGPHTAELNLQMSIPHHILHRTEYSNVLM
jgi:hypothetical protein